jgi:hypothetical protein
MKKLILFSTILAIFWASCDVLDVDPQHSIPSEMAINNSNDVVRAINGCYDAFQSADYYGRNYVAIADLAADNLIWSGTTAGYNQIDNNSILADNTIAEGIWAGIYSALNRVNNVIDRVPEIDDLTQDEKNAYLAEMYFLRALAHYDLMRLFGDIPLRTKPVSPSEDDLNIPRAPVSTVLQQILTDISSAEEHITSTITRGRASLAATLALKARVHLHNYYITENQNHLDSAILASSKVISDFGLSLETDYTNLFTGVDNTESIFEIDFTEQDRNRMAEYFHPTALSGRFEFAPDTSLINAISNEDLRFDGLISLEEGDPFVYKYNDILTGTDNVYVFRLAEMYLIRAEANTLKNAESTIILDDLNAIRERANLLPFNGELKEEILQEIEGQRRIEFAFEGHRWFDLIRTGMAVDVLPGVISADQTLFPIPLNEILANEAIGNDNQNPGY